MKIALCQINTTVSDFHGNAERMLEAAHKAHEQGAELIIFPELAVVGYPPQDLLDRQDFISAAEATQQRLCEELPGTPCIFGNISRNMTSWGKPLHNSAVVAHDGAQAFIQQKSLLPTYDVFDEARHFEPARSQEPWRFGDKVIAVTVCEDLWNDRSFWRRPMYRQDPMETLGRQQLDVIVNISASPFQLGKTKAKREMLAHIASKYKAPLVHVNLVGGNDYLVFDGGSCVFDADGQMVAEASDFEEDLLIVDIGEQQTLPAHVIKDDNVPRDVSAALALGVRDYFGKTGFQQAVVGLSGGIDSAVTAAVAVEALGAENVLGVTMPGPFSSAGSVEDSEALARNLGIALQNAPINDIYEAYTAMFKQLHPDAPFGLAEENVQARIRGNILMAISNRERRLVLATGNKSELAVGYCTLYGDMSGGLAVIGDLPKGMVYGVARWLNRDEELIPHSIIDKAPSAELAPNQRDEDSLPPYTVLDRIVTGYIEEGHSRDELVGEGLDPEVVDRFIRMINLNEYKRNQAAPVLKVSAKAFGIGRRFPIARTLTP